MEGREDGVICLKMARVEMAESLSSDPRFFVMGDNLAGDGMIVYTWEFIPGLPVEYKNWRVEQVDISSIRFDEKGQEAYERRIASRY